MYKNGKEVDFREALINKAAELSFESGNIRKMVARRKRERTSYTPEGKLISGFGSIELKLYLHRVNDVRPAARATNIALGLIRGRTLESMERFSNNEPNWTTIEKMLRAYGPRDFDWEAFERLRGYKAVVDRRKAMQAVIEAKSKAAHDRRQARPLVEMAEAA